MNTFPNPLSPAEETYYIRQYAHGDEHAKQVLIEHNLRLVAHTLKRYPMMDDDLDDLLSIGTIGLIKAIHTFDPEKQYKLSTYAIKCINNEILMYFRMKKKRPQEISLFDPMATDHEGNDIRLLDMLESDDAEMLDQIVQNDHKRKLYYHIENELSQREQLVLKMRYGLYQKKPHTQREIAEQIGISRSYVSRIEKGAIKKLRPFFQKEINI